MADSPTYAAYEKKMLEAEAELGADLTSLAGSIATDIYSESLTRSVMATMPHLPEEKRKRVFAIAYELAQILRASEPPAMRNQ